MGPVHPCIEMSHLRNAMWGLHVSHLAWTHLRIYQKELKDVAKETDVRATIQTQISIRIFSLRVGTDESPH